MYNIQQTKCITHPPRSSDEGGIKFSELLFEYTYIILSSIFELALNMFNKRFITVVSDRLMYHYCLLLHYSRTIRNGFVGKNRGRMQLRNS